jgi:hypothetical protein
MTPDFNPQRPDEGFSNPQMPKPAYCIAAALSLFLSFLLSGCGTPPSQNGDKFPAETVPAQRKPYEESRQEQGTAQPGGSTPEQHEGSTPSAPQGNPSGESKITP